MEKLNTIKIDLFKNGVDNFCQQHPNLIEYKDYVYCFYSSIVFNDKCEKLLVDVLDKYHERIKKDIDSHFIHELSYYDTLNMGFSTDNPIYSFALMCDPKYIEFNGKYVKCFLILYSAYKKYISNKDHTYRDNVFNNLSKYDKVFDQLKDNSNGLFKQIDETIYTNFQYNYAMIIRYTMAYCYYNNYEPDKAFEIVRFFMDNYEQIVNGFDVNGFTRHDRVISDEGLYYYFKYYEDNCNKGSLKVIR